MPTGQPPQLVVDERNEAVEGALFLAQERPERLRDAILARHINVLSSYSQRRPLNEEPAPPTD